MLQLSVPATLATLVNVVVSLEGLVHGAGNVSWSPLTFLVFTSSKRCFRVSMISLPSRILGLWDCKNAA